MTKKRKATGTLGSLLQNIDKVEFEKIKNRMIIAAKIADSLNQKGITQKKFASMMGRTESEISEWLSGDRNFTIGTLTEISLKLNVVLLNTKQYVNYQTSNSFVSYKVKKDDTTIVPMNAEWVNTTNAYSTLIGMSQKIG